jgi:hypothetical protein
MRSLRQNPSVAEAAHYRLFGEVETVAADQRSDQPRPLGARDGHEGASGIHAPPTIRRFRRAIKGRAGAS